MKITRMVVTAAAIAAISTSAFAALSQKYLDFVQGPTQWIMTKDEQVRWKTITTDADAQAFVDLFWARRDPTPATPQNEFREQFEARAKYADDHFAHGRATGSMTDRGHVLIVMGSPSRLQRTSTEPRSTIQTPADAQNDANNPGGVQGYSPKQLWFYDAGKTKTPLNASSVEFVFIDQYGGEEWKLDRTPRTDVIGMMNFVNNASILRPALTVAPTFVPTAPAPVAAVAPVVAAPAVPVIGSFKTDALKAAVDQMRAAKVSPYKNLYVSYGEYITADGNYFVPVQLYVPKVAGLTAAQDFTFFGEVDDAGGKPAAIFEEPAKLTATKDDFFVDRSLTLAPGKYKGTFGIAQDGKPVSMVSTEMNLGALAKDTPSISQLILSNNVYALSAAQNPNDPYSFGGIKVVPKSDRTFTNADELWYFFELRNPGLDPTSNAPKLRVKMMVEGTAAGKSVKYNNPPMDVDAQALKGVAGHYAVGQSIPLTAFKPGDYTLKMTVTDTITKQTYDLQQSFKVVK